MCVCVCWGVAELAIGKVLTANNLCKRGIVIADWCCLCKSAGEIVSHLFIALPYRF